MVCHQTSAPPQHHPSQKRTEEGIAQADPSGGNAEIPTEFTGMDVDPGGFIYATNIDSEGRLSATLRLCFRQAQNRLRSWRAFGNKSPLRASRQKTVLKKLIGSTYLLFLSYFRAPKVHPNSSFPRFTKKPHGFVRPCGLCPFLRFYRSGSIGRIFATNRHYFLTG